jgi:endonuclease YncB( thermonuclease family)
MRLPSPRFWVWVFLGLLVFLRLTLSRDVRGQRKFSDPAPHAGPCEIVEIMAGDTFRIRQAHLDHNVTLRLLGARVKDEHSEEAMRFARKFFAPGAVTLRLDNDRLDRQGRYLAYLEAGGKQLNESLLAAGLARYDYRPGNSPAMDKRLRAAGRGLQR